MENTLQFFNYEDKPVRVIKINDDPWFVAADVCDYFGVTNRSRAMQCVDPEDKGGTQMDTPGGVQEFTIINESGLYSLLFFLQPQKARGVSDEYIHEREAKLKAFKRWVTHEVLPSIRKHGAYMTGNTIERALTDPDFLISLATQLKTEKQKNLTLQVKNSELATHNQIMLPKSEYFDELVDRNLLTNFRETAKQLEIKEKTFMDFLIEKKYIYRDKRGKILPYADKNNGLFEIKESFNEKTNWSGTQTLITPKGRETFRLLMHN